MTTDQILLLINTSLRAIAEHQKAIADTQKTIADHLAKQSQLLMQLVDGKEGDT